MGFLAGKRILITGLLSNRSIAYGIAKAMHREGAELAFTYQNDRFKDRVAKLASDFNSTLLFPLDVQDDAQITDLFQQIGQHWDGLDSLVHSIAFAPSVRLGGQKVINAVHLKPDAHYDVKCADQRDDALNSLSKEEMEEIKEIFQRCDLDGDGGISKIEMESIVRQRTHDPAKPRC